MPPTIGAVAPLLAAEVWTYWISYVLVGGALLMILALAIGYLVRVTSHRYPRQ